MATASSLPPTSELRDQRYGEVLLGSGGLIVPSRLDVYNTIGLNLCPEDLWSKLTVAGVKQETGARFVKLNGPRHWTIDNFVDSALASPTIRSFGGLEMRKAGVLKVSLGMLLFRAPYTARTVQRKTTVQFRAGRPVFQLINPVGDVFFMQSFSLEKDPHQTLATLTTLGSKLRLPTGWTYRSVILRKDYLLKAIDDMATVVQDDLVNTYQKSTAHAGDDL
jgi:hypothetical protein